MEDWFKPNGLPSINKEFTYLLTYLLTKLDRKIQNRITKSIIPYINVGFPNLFYSCLCLGFPVWIIRHHL